MHHYETPVEEALFKRGFLIKKSGNGFTLSRGSHHYDQNDLVELLDKINVPYELEGDLFFVYEDISKNKQQEILLYPACNTETGTPMYLGSWRNFTRRKHGPKTRTIILESGVAILVKALSALGIATVYSCDGHGKKEPNITFTSYHNAVWFKYLQDIYFRDIPLNYEWVIKINSNKTTYLTATEANYDILLLQEDSSKMAGVFLNNDEEIRYLKLRFFGKNKKTTNRRLKGKDYQSTEKIIKEIIAEQKSTDSKV